MQIVYGKFDPELNPPPFSEWSKFFTSVEVDLFQYYSWKPKVQAYFKQWISKKDLKVVPRIGLRTQRSREEYDEAISVWKESFEKVTDYFSIHSGRTVWSPPYLKELNKLAKSENYFYEWGKEDSLKSVEFISELPCFSGWIIDPDWHRTSIPALVDFPLHFKLHGWSTERWVRRYGISQASRILRHLSPRPESTLILSYSGKVAEASLFKD